jgi:hypothetical protein
MKWARSQGAKIHVEAIKQAAKRGSLEAIKWMVGEREDREKGGEEGGRGRGDWKDGWGTEIIMGAGQGGQKEILLWAKEQSLESEEWRNCSGSLEVLKWLKKEGHEVVNLENICSAISKGHVDILKWLVTKDRAYSKELLLRPPISIYSACHDAIERNHVDVQKWLCENSVFPCSVSLQHAAAKHGNSMLLKYYFRDSGVLWNTFTCGSIAQSGNLNLLQWARENGCPWNKLTCSYAASRSLEILQWARENGCPWDESTCAMAKNLEILKWALDNGCPWNKQTCSVAAKTGNLEILKWAREHGCPWDETTCLEAIIGEHVEILNWAITNGCPCDHIKIFQYAIEVENLEVLNWATKNFPRDNNDFLFLVDHAIKRGSSAHVLTWLSKKLNPFPFSFTRKILSFGTTGQKVWLIKKNLEPEFSGIWREIEEIIDFPLSSVAMEEKLGEVIQEPGKVKGFIELVRSNQPGW